ncbi:MAG: hypothetical protein HY663_06925 [Chloroflexi bacterium]|nr:hypothetical protein [Chloroflexota bacterium]
MPLVKLTEDEVASRGSNISSILVPLSRIPSGPAWGRRGGSNGEIIIGMHEGSPSKSDFRDWRFATPTPKFWANYYEIWSLVDEKRRQFCLEKAYLTIYKDEKEFLSLHCDPNGIGVEATERAIYQNGPHLHVKCAESPIPKAHLALTGVHLDKTLADAATLTKTLEWGIQMIRDEVLDRIATGS